MFTVATAFLMLYHNKLNTLFHAQVPSAPILKGLSVLKLPLIFEWPLTYLFTLFVIEVKITSSKKLTILKCIIQWHLVYSHL